MRRYCQHLLQKLSNNGGVDAATEQIKAKQYAEPFKADKKKVIALAIEKAPGAIRIGGFFILYIRQQRCCLSGTTIEILVLVCPNTLTVLTIPEITYIIF